MALRITRVRPVTSHSIAESIAACRMNRTIYRSSHRRHRVRSVADRCDDQRARPKQTMRDAVRMRSCSRCRWTTVHWTDGFWADRLRDGAQALASRDVGDHEGHEVQAVLSAFSDRGRRRSRATTTAPSGTTATSTSFSKAVCGAYAVTRDPELEAILDQSIAAIGRAQRADGYIHTPVLIRQRNGDRDAQAVSGSAQFRDVQHGPSHHGRVPAPSRDGPRRVS